MALVSDLIFQCMEQQKAIQEYLNNCADLLKDNKNMMPSINDMRLTTLKARMALLHRYMECKELEKTEEGKASLDLQRAEFESGLEQLKVSAGDCALSALKVNELRTAPDQEAVRAAVAVHRPTSLDPPAASESD
jgi:hypothetical protein